MATLVNAVGGTLLGQTGTGSFVGSTSPSLVTPSLGTPSSGNLVNCTGYGGNLTTTTTSSNTNYFLPLVTSNSTTNQQLFVSSVLTINPSTLLATFSGGLVSSSINFGGSTLSVFSDTTFTPTMTFETPGDLSVSYGTRNGRCIVIGKQCFIHVAITFTPTYTTASGIMDIGSLPITFSSDICSGPITTSAITYTPFTSIFVGSRGGVNFASIIGSASGSNSNYLDTTNFLSGVTYTLTFNINAFTN